MMVYIHLSVLFNKHLEEYGASYTTERRELLHPAFAIVLHTSSDNLKRGLHNKFTFALERIAIIDAEQLAVRSIVSLRPGFPKHLTASTPMLMYFS